jgi:predicted Zn finger-like uncharacterized protein
MILTCPECATRYFLPDVEIGADGRKVKCAQCGHTWRELPQADIETGSPADQSPLAEHESHPSPAAGLRAEILRSQKEMAERNARQTATVVAAVWAGLAAAVAVLLLAAGVFREQMVRWIPGAATAYAAIGLPVNSAGLLIEKPLAVPGTLLGHRALMVTGVLRNVSGAPVAPPAFRLDILDQKGRTLDRKIIRIAASPLKPGEARPFSLGVADPPAGYQDVAITFALPPPPEAKLAAPKSGAPR